MKLLPPAVLARCSLLLLLAACLAACRLPFGLGQQGGPRPEASKPATPAETCVVLALPASGSHAAIAAKISKGARQAQSELLLRGTKVRLEYVNTDAPDWLQKLDALPEHCAVVGGPLLRSAYTQARTTGSLDKRAFFTFVPALEAGDEGSRAWRFFPSPQDQVDALVTFATDGLGIQTYGAFYPGDAYGIRMSGLLEQSLARRSMVLQKAAYNPGDSASWASAAAPLINASVGPDGKTPVPQTGFEALFLPDSWKNMPMLTASLLYHGEDRLVLLGTTLWEQSLTGRSVPNAGKYALAVFPGAWNPALASQSLRVPDTDFWTALGYDFTRFGVGMGLQARPGAAQVTAAARRAAGMTWNMAPLSWDSAGVAHQKLHVFGVTASGMAPVNVTDFQQARARVRDQAALRLQGLPPVDANGEALTPPAEGAEATATPPAAQPAMAPASQQQPAPAAAQGGRQGAAGTPVMSATPRPSYKLSLPGAR